MNPKNSSYIIISTVQSTLKADPHEPLKSQELHLFFLCPLCHQQSAKITLVLF